MQRLGSGQAREEAGPVYRFFTPNPDNARTYAHFPRITACHPPPAPRQLPSVASTCAGPSAWPWRR
ncbi:hypothetical protein METHP15_870020 [Pseudomonas sp. P15-2025]